jgi:hypothetical protein
MALIQEKQLSSALQTKIDSPNAVSIQSVAVSSSAPASGQVLGYNGTQWAPITPSGGGTPSLQGAYDIGASIAIGANGAVAISNSTQSVSLLTLNKTEVNGGDVQSITNAGTGHALLITNSNSGNALRVVQNTTNAEVIRVVKNSTGAGNLLYLNNKGAGTTLNIYNESTASAITITSSAAGSITCVDIANTSTGAGINISQNGAGNAINITAGAAVALNISQANNNGLATLAKSGTGAGDVVTITNAGTGDGLAINQNGVGYGIHLSQAANQIALYVSSTTGTNTALYVEHQSATGIAATFQRGTDATRYAQFGRPDADANGMCYVYRNQASDGGPVVKITQDHASNAQHCLTISQDGTGDGLNVTKASGAGNAVSVSNAGSGDCLSLTATAATARGLYVSMGASTTGDGINIAMNAAATGNALDITGGAAHAITITQAQNYDGLNINRSGAGANNGITVAHAGTGVGISVTCSGSASAALTVDGGASSGYSVSVTGSPSNCLADIYRTTNGDLVWLRKTTATGTGIVLSISNSGTGHCITMSSSTATADAHIALETAIAPASNSTGDLYRCSTDTMDCLAYYNGSYVWRHNNHPLSVQTSGPVNLDKYASGLTYTNRGAAGEVSFILPVPIVGLYYTFIVLTAQNLYVKTQVGDYIRNAGTAGGDGGVTNRGRLLNATIGSVVRVYCVSTTNLEWIVVYFVGTWAVSTGT